MENFFIKQWSNFKKNWYWYILCFFISLISIYSCISFIDNTFYYLYGKSFFNSNLIFYDYTALYSVIGYIFFRFSFELELYIFSYYIYTGKNNWYKFFREREKLHKKEDREAYKEYLKSQKSE